MGSTRAVQNHKITPIKFVQNTVTPYQKANQNKKQKPIKSLLKERPLNIPSFTNEEFFQIPPLPNIP